MMEKKRSIGVTILGTYTMIGYIVNLFITLVFLAIANKALPVLAVKYVFVAPFQKSLWESALSIIFIILFFIVGYNILRLKNWARKFIVVCSVVEISLGLILLITLAPILMATKLSTIVLGGIYFYFFTRPEVKRQFIEGGAES